MSRPEATAVVVRPGTASYPYSVRLVSGEPVAILKSDPEFPGWLWCRAPDGKEAWIPESFIEPMGETASDETAAESGRGRMRRDYDSTELTIAAGETLVLVEEESGWAWTENVSGQRGWIPAACLG